jgi:hypothetical protein
MTHAVGTSCHTFVQALTETKGTDGLYLLAYLTMIVYTVRIDMCDACVRCPAFCDARI